MRHAATLALLLISTLATLACSSGPTKVQGPGPTPSPSNAPSPSPSPSPEDASCTDPRPSATHVCVQDCGPPVVRDGDPPPAWRWLTLAEADLRRQHGCPRCLGADTRLATPRGDVRIAEFAIGDPVWTLDAAGRRVAARVEYVGSTPVSGPHQLVRLTLADGRTVAASPGHPTADGRAFSALAVGAPLSGSTIVAVERIAFAGTRTYDVLPSGPTGAYWADGVLLGSTFTSR